MTLRVRTFVAVGSALAAAGTVHTLVNLRYLRRPETPATAVEERVSVLIPARNEAHQIEQCVSAVLAQQSLDDLEVIVLDDGSTDGTGELARAVVAGHPHVARVISASDSAPPAGWLGKPWASQRLAEAATGSVLVFVDADVVLAPHAIASAVSLLRQLDLDLVSPYPRQIAEGPLPRLVQPLLQWSWLTTLPLRASERSSRESLAVANGQFLVADAHTFRRAGGFSAVRGAVIDDVALLRAVLSVGGRGTVVDGSEIATCRMYATGREVVDGYSKSLWSAFGGPAGSVGVCALMLFVYVMPPVAMAMARQPATRVVGAAGYAAAVAGRLLVARGVRQRAWPDALAHPLSISAFVALNAVSWARLRRGSLTWKGRAVTGSAT